SEMKCEAIFSQHVLAFVMDNAVRALQLALPAWTRQGLQHYRRVFHQHSPVQIRARLNLIPEHFKLTSLYEDAVNLEQFDQVSDRMFTALPESDRSAELLTDSAYSHPDASAALLAGIRTRVGQYSKDCRVHIMQGDHDWSRSVNVWDECERELQKEQ